MLENKSLSKENQAMVPLTIESSDERTMPSVGPLNASVDHQFPPLSRRRSHSRSFQNSAGRVSLSWPHFGLLGASNRRGRGNVIFTSKDSIVVVHDQSSTWNLDVETGQIEQAILRSPSSRSGGNCCNPLLAFCGIKGAVGRIEEYGGDFPSRAGEALRASLGSCIFFSSLVFSSPTYLGAIWIGNIFFHSALNSNAGEALQAARGFATSILLTTLVSWPVAYFLGQASQMVAQVSLPPITVALSLLIMTCPWLTSPNLMILVMYVVIAAPVRFDSTMWWEPLGYMGSYLIGLGVAVAMQLLPIIPPVFRPNTATRQVHKLLDGLSQDFFLLFVQARHYTYSTGESPTVARAAGAAIEVLVSRMTSTIQDLKRLLPAAKNELLLWRAGSFCNRNRSSAAAARVERLAKWIQTLEAVVTYMKMLRCTLNSRFLGEEESEKSATNAISTRHIRRVIASELGHEYHGFIDSLIHVSVALNRQADPTTASELLDSVETTQLSDALDKTKRAFGRAVKRVITELQVAREVGNRVPASSVPIFAHVARRSTSINSLLSIAEALLEHCASVPPSEAPNSQGAQSDDEDQGLLVTVSAFFYARLGLPINSILKAWWTPKWHWRDSIKRRLALKTALGMMFASLWIAVPQLWEVSEPFGLWPGLTVASVNLPTTGSSFHKAVDRLVGTLFAAAYALLVVEFFPASQDSVKILAIAFFTFFVIYMKKDDHAYQYSYAATSIGSMMYGSVKVDFDIEGYIPQRIQLIFVGVIIFALIELFIFPKSSRIVVETNTLRYFEVMGTFLKKARNLARIVSQSGTIQEHCGDSSRSVIAPSAATVMCEELCKTEAELKSLSLTLKGELQSALLEPYFGFAQKLHSQSMSGMVSEICESETQALLLVKALRMVVKYVEQAQAKTGADSRNLWPCAYARFLDSAGIQMHEISHKLSSAYPDGRFRPQSGNTVRAITAAASFRDFRDLRFSIVTKWSEQFQEVMETASTENPEELIVMGITTSFILELCRHLQLAGRGMEWAAGHFPALR